MIKSETQPQLIKRLDAVFSKYIRLRDADDNGICRCITCGTPHNWKNIQNGHHFKRQYMSVRFHEMNCNSQCVKCNWLGQGEDVKYREALIKKYGQGEYDKLLWTKHQPKKWSRGELEILIEHYKKQVDELLKTKGL